MANKNKVDHINLFIILPITFILGIFSSYLIISYTNIIPLNYEKKFEIIYDAQSRERGWETYLDLIKGYTLNYPDYEYVDRGIYIPTTRRSYGLGGGGLLTISNGKEAVMAYDTTINLLMYGYDDKKGLLDFAKDNPIQFLGYSNDTQYQSSTVNGAEAIIADFVMSQKLYKELTDMQSIGVKGPIEPVGFKRRTVYIRHNGFVYILKSGSLYDETKKDIFNKILQSFRFLY